jgi:hypothetical protein
VFFRLTVPIEVKPLSLIKQGHNTRIRKKRGFRKQLRFFYCEDFLKIIDSVKDVAALNIEVVVPQINAFEAEFISRRKFAMEQFGLSHSAFHYLADEKSFGR